MNVRRYALIASNLAAAAVLALVLLPEPEEPTATITKTPMAKAVRPAVELVGLSENMPRSKPLFVRQRAPLELTAPVVKPPSPAAPTFRLVGILWREGEKLVILQPTGDSGYKRLKLGEASEGWTLRELTPRTASFSADDRKATLALIHRRNELQE